jgi:RNA 2',3'-cyclic 3'-phosphodiesterase
MRLFLAINLPAETRAEILAATQPLRDAAPTLAWAPAEQLHLTTKFLGEHPDVLVDQVGPLLAAVAARHGMPLLHVGGIGAFPNFSAPRVVWMGVGADPRLELIHHEVETACASLGLPIDGRPFRPHVTLARVRDNQRANGAMLRGLSEAAANVEFEADVIGRSIDLMRSELLPSGARHSIVMSAPLRSV